MLDVRVTGLPAHPGGDDRQALSTAREKGIFSIGETFIYRLKVENDAGTEPHSGDEGGLSQLPPELEFVQGPCRST